MNSDTVSHVKKISISILIVSITSLILLSFLPWVVVNPNTSSEQYLNFKMMKESDFAALDGSTNLLSAIQVIFWAIIVIAIITLFSSVLCLSKKIQIINSLLIAIGCSIIVLVSLNLIYFINLIKEINENNLFDHANLFGPFSYAYFLFIFMIALLVISIFYTINIITFLLECLRSKDKAEPSTKKIKKEEIKKKDAKTIAYKNKLQTEDWAEDSEEQKEEDPPIKEKEEKTISNQKDEDIKIKQVEKTYFENKTIDLEKKHAGAVQDKKSKSTDKEEEIVITEKKETKKPDNQKEDLNFLSFEKALNSAIEKKKKEKLEEPSNNKQDKKTITEKKKIKVRCAKCKHTFTAELSEGKTKIKCPNCGKEGSIK
jgi:DNA-directed RNA polymerase subunit RPC12/RpoP